LIGLLTVASVITLADGAGAAETERGEVNQKRSTGPVQVSAYAEWLPRGSAGGTDSSCSESSVQLLVADDFVEPVTTAYHVVDVRDGETVTAFRFTAAVGRPQGERLFSPTGAWYRVSCDGSVSLVPEGGPAITIPALVAQAVDSIDPPEPMLAVTPDHGRHVVQMPSWLAVDPAYWSRPRTASAAAGRVVVTASLTPYETEWDLGNGDTVTCPNGGTVWRAGMAESRSECGYTYTWPSIDPPDNTYDLAGTVRFQVGYITNAPGVYGPFIPVERTTTETIQVVEIQAIGT
jgi:hypothetical protein